MKKEFMTAGVACAAALALFAASDRIDIFNNAGQFISIMVDDIQEITLGEKTADQDGYTTVNVSTTNGTKTREIATFGDIIYTPVDWDKAHEIALADAPNARVVLYDCRNNTDYYGEAQIDPTKPADWHGCPPDQNPHFLIDTDKGFASEFAVKGLYTGKVYTDNPNFIFWSTGDTNLLGLDTYSFNMPFEPVEISVSSVELETYLGKEFLGTYTGFIMSPGENRIVHKMPATLTAEFRYNGTYVMKSTDEHNFDFLDLFDWDEEKNTFAYVPYTGRPLNEVDLEVKTGVTGSFADGGLLFAQFHDLLSDKPENTIHYFAAKGEYEFSIASADSYNNRMLIQAMPVGEGTPRYFYSEFNGTPVEVAMEFTYGSNIGEDCAAFASVDGEKLFKYDYKGPGYDPVFTFRGAEYGTYTGSGDDLWLDGFGSCTLGDATGKYTINGGLATVTIGDETRLFVLDHDALTYSEMTADTWDGASQYTKQDAVGAFGNEEESAANYMCIDFDKNFSGADEPGTASVRFNVVRNDGFGGGVSEMVASSGRYIYNAASKTIVITNVYMGTSATTSGRRNLVLKVSDDLLSMWIDDSAEDRIYGSGRNGSYLLTGTVNTLTAPAPVIDVELAPKYTGTPTFDLFGSPTPTQTTLTFNTDNQTAHLSVIAMNNSLFDCDVQYSVAGNTVTLHDVRTYPDGRNYVLADLVFVAGEDGNLTSGQTLPGAINGNAYNVDFSSAPLVPEVAPVELAAKYTGTPNFDLFGSPTPTQTTLTFNTDNQTAHLSVIAMNNSLFDCDVQYSVAGNTVTLHDVRTYPDGRNYVLADLVFVAGEDGNLTSGQTLPGAINGNAYNVDFSSAPLVPEAAVTTVELAPKYTGTPNMIAFGNTMGTETTLTFNADNQTAHLSVVGLGSSLFDCDVQYSLEGTTVTLHDVPTYPNNNGYISVPADLVYVVGEDGNLTSEQTLTGATRTGNCIDVDFSSAPLTPAE